jgi:hypothetical protein
MQRKVFYQDSYLNSPSKLLETIIEEKEGFTDTRGRTKTFNNFVFSSDEKKASPNGNGKGQGNMNMNMYPEISDFSSIVESKDSPYQSNQIGKNSHRKLISKHVKKDSL